MERLFLIAAAKLRRATGNDSSIVDRRLLLCIQFVISDGGGVRFGQAGSTQGCAPDNFGSWGSGARQDLAPQYRFCLHGDVGG